MSSHEKLDRAKDSTLVAMGDEAQVLMWTEAFAISRLELQEAVDSAGTSGVNVVAYIASKKDAEWRAASARRRKAAS